MITIKEVLTKKESKLFTIFPHSLYENVAEYVPPLNLDEIELFDPNKNPIFEYCEAIRFLAYKGDKIVGRVAGIINLDLNKNYNKAQVRFTRLDMIDDIEVTKALIKAVEDWGKSKGMTEIIGPIGFSDLDRQGMLVEGYDKLNMFITIYNFPYYVTHMEKLGFIKDVDWIEKQIPWPNEVPDKVKRGAKIARDRYGFKLLKLTKRKDIYKYMYDTFDMYNIAFKELYGFYPISRKVMDYYVKQFIQIVRLDLAFFVLDKDGEIAGFTVIMPSLANAVKKSKGKLLPFGLLRILRAVHKFDVIDFFFIAIHPKHQGKGVIAMMFEDGIKIGIKHGVKYAETGPELELNMAIQNQWKDFPHINHKRRRCYIKPL